MDNYNHGSHSSRRHGGSGGRDDCWSEGGTETLIESWADRYLQLNRGILRQKDWTEIAQTVNANRRGLKPPRTDAQCKNRIDTLKKKYKLEKSKPAPSKWPFFRRLDDLIGASNSVARKKTSNPRSTSGSLSAKLNLKLKPDLNPNPNLKAIAYYARSLDDDDSLGRMESVDFAEETTSYKELARSIVRFGEVYERIENSKQEEMMKLEKQRMEFTKEIEFQRLNMFIETQFELEKMKNMKKVMKKKMDRPFDSSNGSSSEGKKLEL